MLWKQSFRKFVYAYIVIDRLKNLTNIENKKSQIKCTKHVMNNVHSQNLTTIYNAPILTIKLSRNKRNFEI